MRQTRNKKSVNYLLSFLITILGTASEIVPSLTLQEATAAVATWEYDPTRDLCIMGTINCTTTTNLATISFLPTFGRWMGIGLTSQNGPACSPSGTPASCFDKLRTTSPNSVFQAALNALPDPVDNEYRYSSVVFYDYVNNQSEYGIARMHCDYGGLPASCASNVGHTIWVDVKVGTFVNTNKIISPGLGSGIGPDGNRHCGAPEVQSP